MTGDARAGGRARAAAVLCALPQELGGLRERSTAAVTRSGLELRELAHGPLRALLCVGGVGKVHAAHAAAVLLAEGVELLLVVGVCGGLVRGLGPGDLVHCEAAVQGDLVLGRSPVTARPAAEVRAAWQALAPGRSGVYVTRDRAAIMPWRRVLLARRFGGLAADMETAAAGCVAERAGVPWAALRAVTDGRWWGGHLAFRQHFAPQAGRAADTVPTLLERLAAAGPEASSGRAAADPPEPGPGAAPATVGG